MKSIVLNPAVFRVAPEGVELAAKGLPTEEARAWILECLNSVMRDPDRDPERTIALIRAASPVIDSEIIGVACDVAVRAPVAEWQAVAVTYLSQAANKLGTVRSAARSPMMDLLKGDDAEARSSAIEWLRHSGDIEALRTLAPLSSHQQTVLADQAALAVSNMMDWQGGRPGESRPAERAIWRRRVAKRV